MITLENGAGSGHPGRTQIPGTFGTHSFRKRGSASRSRLCALDIRKVFTQFGLYPQVHGTWMLTWMLCSTRMLASFGETGPATLHPEWLGLKLT